MRSKNSIEAHMESINTCLTCHLPQEECRGSRASCPHGQKFGLQYNIGILPIQKAAGMRYVMDREGRA